MLEHLPSPHRLIARAKPVVLRSISLVPFSLQKRLAEKVINPLFDEPIEDGDLDLLEGKILALTITETGQSWHFTLNGKQLEMVNNSKAADITISGSIEAFLLMSNHLEDPDTLFFQRYITIEGDTELGLTIKNSLYNIDNDRLPKAAQQFLQLAGKVAQAIYKKERENELST